MKSREKIDFYKRIPRETIPTTFFSIFRNKRRSMAMISGIILAMTLLSGIFLYNAELKQDNYETMVEDFPYEIRFDIIGNETVPEMRKLSDQIGIDPRVLDTAVIGSVYSNLRNNWLEAFVYPEYNNESENNVKIDTKPSFVDVNFFNGLIGEKVLDMDFKGEANLNGKSVIVSEQLLNDFGLNIGDMIDSIN